jgi:DNA-binding NarL/FixJ family response regulator
VSSLLIVDDDAVDREQARRLLAVLPDLEIREAVDGAAGLAAIEEERPDLVLSDIRMPRLDGLELVREVKQRFPLVPVILMTSRGNEQVAAEALRAGAASYVPKSDLAEHLAETVQPLLALTLARRERSEVLAHLESSEQRFTLENDPRLIAPLVAFLQEELARGEFGDETVRSQTGTALMEALSNAMIHGNLEVSSDLRREGSEPYHRMIAERLASAPWNERRVSCRAQRTPAEVSFVIADEGPGFDPSVLPDPTRPEGMLKARGRGLFLIHAFMDEVEHSAKGNEIRLTKRA